MKYTPILIVSIAVILLGAACQKTPTNNTTQVQKVRVDTDALNINPEDQSTIIEATLELANLGGVSFASHTPGTATAGSFSMSKTYLDAGAGRIVPAFMFGQALPGRATTQLNPNLEFGGLPTALDVIASIDGVVFVRQQRDSSDYEVFLQPQDGSTWTVGYDHLTDLTVATGDRVTIGQVLGKAARENNGMYRYELQVNQDISGVTTFHCPTELLRADVKTTTVAAIEQFIRDWNVFYGSNAYGSITSSCTKPTLSLAETGV